MSTPAIRRAASPDSLTWRVWRAFAKSACFGAHEVEYVMRCDPHVAAKAIQANVVAGRFKRLPPNPTWPRMAEFRASGVV